MTITLKPPSRTRQSTGFILRRAVAALAHGLGWPGRIWDARRLMRQLGGLDEHALRDIGLTHQDLHDAASRVFDPDPSRHLRQRVAERRQSRQPPATPR